MAGTGWGEILAELNAVAQAQPGIAPFDPVRRKYLAQLAAYTGRATFLYATQWTQPGAPAPLVQITDEDVHGLMEVIRGVKGKDLDLILHSPGGSPEATEGIVDYLRSKFSNIRVIVPHAAMSAATMLACASNRIVMARHSFLGPIDPQMMIPGPNGLRAYPAQAILEQFDKALEECTADSARLGTWMPILGQYGPSLLVECQNATNLARRLVGRWIWEYMFDGDPSERRKATGIAQKLSNHKRFLSHGRHISRSEAEAMGLVVESLEDDQTFQDLVMAVYHATAHTFGGTPAVKIIENHVGHAFVKHHVVPRPIQVVQGPPQGAPGLGVPVPPSSPLQKPGGNPLN